MREETKQEYLRWQQATLSYVEEVVKIATASPMHTGAKLDNANRQLIVFGVGDPPEALGDAIARAPEIINVTWQQAPHTLAELTAELRRILSEKGGRLNGGWPLTDGTGIGLTTTDQSLLNARDPRAALGAHYPVAIEYGEPPIPL